MQAIAKWYLEHRPEFLESEIIVCSVTHRYAGRYDAKLKVGGRVALLDLKTSKPTTWKDWAKSRARSAYVQLAGYALAQAEMDGSPVIDLRYILRADAEGNWDFMPDLCPRESEHSFLSKLETYRTDLAYGRAVTAAKKAA